MKKQNGITLIALIITIIVMLILVGVTINVTLNGGLFTTAQKAADGTKKEAEKEQLLEAILAAVGTDGEVDFAKVVLPDNFEKVRDSVYKNKKSGITYAVNKKTLEITESSGDSEDVDNPILGTYYEIGGDISGSVRFELKSNNKAFLISDGADDGENQGTYTYDDTTKAGKITIQYKEIDSSTNEVTIESMEFPFNYVEITDESNNIINSILEATQNVSNENITVVFAKQGTTGLIPLTGYVYENGTETIEFDTYVENGITLGVYTITRSDGSSDGVYVYYNGKFIWDEKSEAIISNDYSTITIDGTVYTKR